MENLRATCPACRRDLPLSTVRCRGCYTEYHYHCAARLERCEVPACTARPPVLPADLPAEAIADPRTLRDRFAETFRRLSINSTDYLFFAAVAWFAIALPYWTGLAIGWLVMPFVLAAYVSWIVALAHRPGADLALAELAALPVQRAGRLVLTALRVCWRTAKPLAVCGTLWALASLISDILDLRPLISIVFLCWTALVWFRLQLATVLAYLPSEFGGDDPVEESQDLVAAAIPTVLLADAGLLAISIVMPLCGWLGDVALSLPGGGVAAMLRGMLFLLVPAVQLTYLVVLIEDCRRASTRTL